MLNKSLVVSWNCQTIYVTDVCFITVLKNLMTLKLLRLLNEEREVMQIRIARSAVYPY